MTDRIVSTSADRHCVSSQRLLECQLNRSPLLTLTSTICRSGSKSKPRTILVSSSASPGLLSKTRADRKILCSHHHHDLENATPPRMDHIQTTVQTTICQYDNTTGGKVGSDSIISEFGPEAGGPGWSFGEETPYAEVSPELHDMIAINISIFILMKRLILIFRLASSGSPRPTPTHPPRSTRSLLPLRSSNRPCKPSRQLISARPCLAT